uniref:Uncharacterized protein n=1 Tax=Anopheles christyi TaxID=43041 RepID=A0A182KEW1_9DIPT
MKPRSSCGHLAQAMVMVWLLHASTLLLSSTNGEEYDSSYDEQEELSTDYSNGGLMAIHKAFQSHCHSCQYRNVYAMASLKSIKAHVLMKLGIDFMPNRTRYPVIPDNIVESFFRQQPSQYSSSTVGDKDYMQDDPSAGVEEEVEEDFDYYPITNKIYILAKRE